MRAHGKNSRASAPNLTSMTCTPFFDQSMFSKEGCKKAHLHLNGKKWTTQKVFVGHLHHYSESVPMIWDPKTKLVSPQFHVMFDDKFDTVQAPAPNVKITDTMDAYSKQIAINMTIPSETNTHIYFHGGVDIHPNKLSPNLETCQESMAMTSTDDDNHS
jgi:hypothetical protein